MISMTVEQKNEFSRLRKLVESTSSLDEARQYSSQLNMLIEQANTQNPTAKGSFTEEQLILYMEYREKLKKAKYPRQVRLYKEKIQALLAEVDETIV